MRAAIAGVENATPTCLVLIVWLELVRAYLKGARRYHTADPLVDALERLEADFAGRFALAEKVIDDLQETELRDMRG
jgi:uncharacterized membrane protein